MKKKWGMAESDWGWARIVSIESKEGAGARKKPSAPRTNNPEMMFQKHMKLFNKMLLTKFTKPEQSWVLQQKSNAGIKGFMATATAADPSLPGLRNYVVFFAELVNQPMESAGNRVLRQSIGNQRNLQEETARNNAIRVKTRNADPVLTED